MNNKKIVNTNIHYWTNDLRCDDAIVFLHPAFVTHESFNKQYKYFENKYKLIALDLIGHGESIGPGKITDTAFWINQIMEQEKVLKVHLVGVSIGGVLALDFANKYPKKVGSVFVVGAYDINNFDKSISKGNNTEQMKMMFKALFSIKWFAKDNMLLSAFNPIAQKEFYEMNIHFKRRSFRYLASLNKLINKNTLDHRDYSLFIGVGEHDAYLAKKAAKIFYEHENIEGRYLNDHFVTLKIFEDAGHVVNMDIPDVFNQELNNFLKKSIIEK